MFVWLVRRDLLLAWRRRSEVLADVFFFVIVVSLFPLSVSPDPQLLRSIAPGAVWVAVLLASLSCLGRLFAADYADGTLEQMLLTPQPLYLVVLGKVCAQLLVAGLPLALAAPLLGVQLGLSGGVGWALTASLLLGVPVLTLIGSIVAALTLGLRNGTILLSLLSLPLFIPVLVFGVGAVEGTLSTGDRQANVLLLAALLIVAVVLAPGAGAAALRISLE